MKPDVIKEYKGRILVARNINWSQHPESAWQVNVEKSLTGYQVFYGTTSEETFGKAERFVDTLPTNTLT